MAKRKNTKKPTTKKTTSKRTAKPEPSFMGLFWARQREKHGKAFARVVVHVVLIAGICVGGAAVLSAMRKTVDRERTAAGNVTWKVELVDAPAWMPGWVQQNIIRNLTPKGLTFGNKTLCREVFSRAESIAWIASVEKVWRERPGPGRGVIRLRAVWRRPAARISIGGVTYYVDAEGVVLPHDQVPKWTAHCEKGYVYSLTNPEEAPAGTQPVKKHYIQINGIRTEPPGVGEVWNSERLVAGLRSVELFNGRDYHNQIRIIDVKNLFGTKRYDPQIVFHATTPRSGETQINFGRFPDPRGGDSEIPTERKLEYLDKYVREHRGLLTGKHSVIDLRFDPVNCY